MLHLAPNWVNSVHTCRNETNQSDGRGFASYTIFLAETLLLDHFTFSCSITECGKQTKKIDNALLNTTCGDKEQSYEK